MHNHVEQIRAYSRQAAECAQQADAQMDPKVKQQFLVLTRLWLILADRFELESEPTYRLARSAQALAVKRKAEEDWAR